LNQIHSVPSMTYMDPKIRDGLLDEATALGRTVFSAHFVSRDRGWHLQQLAPRVILPSVVGLSKASDTARPWCSIVRVPKSAKAPGITTFLEWRLLAA
jgi:hypothetical protein